MIRLKNILFFFFLFFILCSSWAQTSKGERWLDLEWEPVEGAIAYEVELYEIKEGRYYTVGTFKTDVSRWTKNVQPGKYVIKMRSLDSRGVGGEWSEEIPVPVKLPFPQKNYPRPGEVFEVEDGKGKEVFFQWEGVAGASFYKLNIYDENGAKLYSTITSEQQVSLHLERLARYEWEVLPLFSKEDQVAEKSSTQPFTLIGGELKTPDLESKVLDKEVLVTWGKVENATSYEYEILQEKNGKQNILKKDETNQAFLTMPKKDVKPGLFLIHVKAKARGYKDSPLAEIIYEYDLKEIKQVLVKKENPTLRKRDYLDISVGQTSLDYEYLYYEKDTYANQSLQGYQFDLAWGKEFYWTLTSLTKLKVLSLSDNYASSLFLTASQDLYKMWQGKSWSWGMGLGVQVDRVSFLTPDRLNLGTMEEESAWIAGGRLGGRLEYRFSPDLRFSYGPQYINHFKPLSSSDGTTIHPSQGHEHEFKANYYIKSNLDLTLNFIWSSHEYKKSAKVGAPSLAREGDIDSLTLTSKTYGVGVRWYY